MRSETRRNSSNTQRTTFVSITDLLSRVSHLITLRGPYEYGSYSSIDSNQHHSSHKNDPLTDHHTYMQSNPSTSNRISHRHFVVVFIRYRPSYLFTQRTVAHRSFSFATELARARLFRLAGRSPFAHRCCIRIFVN